MDLSICIPVFNTNINPLVREISLQAEKLPAKVEVVILDDASDEAFRKLNRTLKELPQVVIEELPENVGRAAIRNRLAEKSAGKLLLFLDDDSMPARPDFLKRYLDTEVEAVCCGGRLYPAEDPGRDYRLHYTYGRFRESRPAEKRAVQPYRSFHSNNFLVRREVLLSNLFDENLRQYGHEDTFFAFQLKRNKIALSHIDNPVIHTQLETNKEFLMKTRQGVQNLKQLQQREEKDFINFIKLLKTAERVKKSGLEPVINKIYKRNHRKWEQLMLTSEKPSIRIFNLYKLGYLLSL